MGEHPDKTNEEIGYRPWNEFSVMPGSIDQSSDVAHIHNFQIVATPHPRDPSRLVFEAFMTHDPRYVFRCELCRDERNASLAEAARKGWIAVEGKIPESKFNRTAAQIHEAQPQPHKHQHRASCHGAIGELLCGE